MIKTFKQFIAESLNDKQKAAVNKWKLKPGHTAFSDHVFGNKDRIHIPLEEDGTPIEAPESIRKHLDRHGYTVSDYKKGYAKDKFNRDVSIGKVLQKTNAPDEIKHQFLTDPSRRSSQNSNMHVVISRHPHDIAAMSTGRGWKSCMEITGCKIPDEIKADVKAGTHTAYLVHKDDINIENPIARINLKKLSTPDKKDHILRPSVRVYGSATPDFLHTVKKWSQEHFPATSNKYVLPNGVYQEDDDLNAIYSHSYALKILKNTDIPFDSKAYRSLHHSGYNGHELLHDKLDHPLSEHERAAIAQVGDDSHRQRLIKDKSPHVRQAIARYGNDSHRDQLINDPSSDVRINIAIHGNHSHRDKLIKDRLIDIRATAADAGNHSHHKIAMFDKSPYVREVVADKTTSKEILNHLINDKNSLVSTTASNRYEDLKDEKKLTP